MTEQRMTAERRVKIENLAVNFGGIDANEVGDLLNHIDAVEAERDVAVKALEEIRGTDPRNHPAPQMAKPCPRTVGGGASMTRMDDADLTVRWDYIRERCGGDYDDPWIDTYIRDIKTEISSARAEEARLRAALENIADITITASWTGYAPYDKATNVRLGYAADPRAIARAALAGEPTEAGV